MPNGDDQNVYLVVDDFGRNGRAYREVDGENTDLETAIVDLVEGHCISPVRVVAFQHRREIVAADVAHELRQRCDMQMRDVPFFLQDFVDQYEGTTTISYRRAATTQANAGLKRQKAAGIFALRLAGFKNLWL
jgi:hypothetical protein